MNLTGGTDGVTHLPRKLTIQAIRPLLAEQITALAWQDDRGYSGERQLALAVVNSPSHHGRYGRETIRAAMAVYSSHRRHETGSLLPRRRAGRVGSAFLRSVIKFSLLAIDRKQIDGQFSRDCQGGAVWGPTKRRSYRWLSSLCSVHAD